MITTTKSTSIHFTGKSGALMRADYGRGQPLSDVICNLIRHSGLTDDIEAIKQIKAELDKAL